MSKTTDHLAKARDYIAIAESGDSKREAYAKAREELLSARTDMTIRDIAQAVGKGKSWVGDLLAWDPTNSGSLPFERDRKDTHEIRQQRDTEKVLSDPDRTREVMANLPAKHLDALASAATDTLIERHRAERSEHTVRPTARELMGSDKFDPSELWADTPLISVSRAVDVLASRVQRAGGVILGALSQDEAYERLIQAERQISEIRAAVQEQIRDEVNV